MVVIMLKETRKCVCVCVYVPLKLIEKKTRKERKYEGTPRPAIIYSFP